VQRLTVPKTRSIIALTNVSQLKNTTERLVATASTCSNLRCTNLSLTIAHVIIAAAVEAVAMPLTFTVHITHPCIRNAKAWVCINKTIAVLSIPTAHVRPCRPSSTIALRHKLVTNAMIAYSTVLACRTPRNKVALHGVVELTEIIVPKILWRVTINIARNNFKESKVLAVSAVVLPNTPLNTPKPIASTRLRTRNHAIQRHLTPSSAHAHRVRTHPITHAAAVVVILVVSIAGGVVATFIP
jgi:hypothetical protein